MIGSVFGPDTYLLAVVELGMHSVVVAAALAVGRCCANRRDWQTVAFGVPVEDPALTPAGSVPLCLRPSYASSRT